MTNEYYSSMQSIHQLSARIIDKIAAGEVVERPAYALKELLDNAVDAHASHIDIEIEDGGLGKISVTDNGIGMTKEDIRISFLAHTTSKISTEDDLYNIKTLGFRGEGLSSIKAVADVTIISRTIEDEIGKKIELKNSEIENIQNISIAQGTTVTIEKLFQATPARKKFLKSTSTETRYCLDMIISCALINHTIGFSVVNNGKRVLHLAKSETFLERTYIVFASELQKYLLSCNHDEEYVKIEGYIGAPQITALTATKQ